MYEQTGFENKKIRCRALIECPAPFMLLQRYLLYMINSLL